MIPTALEEIKQLLSGVPEDHAALRAIQKYQAWRISLEVDAAVMPSLGDEGRHFNAGRASASMLAAYEWEQLCKQAKQN